MNIGVVLFHEVNELDVVGPYAVLDTARTFLDEAEMFDLFTVAKSRNSVQTAADMTITPSWAFASAPPVDVLIVPGGRGVEGALKDKPLQQYLHAQRPNLKIIASISGGALLLGALGVLKNQVVTTHPDLYQRVEDYEVLRVSKDRVVKNEGGVWCAAGSAAGLELALELVRHLYDDALAKRVATHLGLTTTQPGLF
ncbi:DJ-1/PfpI family protein [soil metagenome]